MAIAQTISAISPAGHRGVDSRTTFVTKQEAFQDDLTDTFVTEINQAISEINTTETNINNKESSATSSASAASTSATNASNSAILASQWAENDVNVEVEAGKYSAKHYSQVAANTVSALPDGVINDVTITLVDTWSSSKINSEFGLRDSAISDNTTLIATKKQKYTQVTKTANYTANVYEYINCDTSGGAFTITLPSTPNALDEVVIDVVDATNTITIDGGTINLNGTTDTSLEINSNISLLFTYNNLEWRVS